MQTHIDYTSLTSILSNATQEGRNFLFEYEVYDFIRSTGGETPPQFYFLAQNDRLEKQNLQNLPGDKVVVKIVSPYILHKSDVGGVSICNKTQDEVLSTIRRMSHEIPQKFIASLEQNPEFAPAPYRNLSPELLEQSITSDIKGYILCQYMQPDSEEFGNELLVSLRNSREFGMILSAGLGGRDTELYAARFRKGQAVVSASTEQVDGQSFFKLFQNTISYKKLAGLTRGQKRIVTDHQLLECFEALVQVARYFSPSNDHSPYVIEELEINPFAFSNYLMMPLDGLCKFSTRKQIRPTRPIEKIDKLLHPQSIGIAGISRKKTNIGRIILDNILANSYSKENLVLIHPEAGEIEGIATIPDITHLSSKIDLLILAIDGTQIPGMIEIILEKNLAESVILVSGGLGEKEEQQNLVGKLQEKIVTARRTSSETAIFLGANSLGILSHPGSYDAMFIPDTKLPKQRGNYSRSIGLVSQSGAYLITRMSKLSFLDPAYAISIGNQLDLTAGDFLLYLNEIKDLKTLAFYLEGFTDLDGLSFSQATREAIALGKEVVFYKAGRTPEGKDALSGHTASIAGDYMVCESCIDQAGAMIAETFNEFEGLLRLSHTLHDKIINGNRLAAVSNAGYEAVGIADNLLGDDYALKMATFSTVSTQKLESILAKADLMNLTSVHNPLDITPMAAEDVYLEVIKTLLNDQNVDAIVVAIVPLTPMLHTLPEEIESFDQFHLKDSLVEQIAKIDANTEKPLVIVVDSGKLYDPLADAFQDKELAVFRSADIAVRVLGKYIQNRMQNQNG